MYNIHVQDLNLYLKQGIGYVYDMVDFICIDLMERRGTQNKQE